MLDRNTATESFIAELDDSHPSDDRYDSGGSARDAEDGAGTDRDVFDV